METIQQQIHTLIQPQLKEGEIYVGAILSADGTKNHAIILLPSDHDDSNWKDAMDWAASIGGELPDRCESALLFATMKDEFKPEWYWLRESYAYNDAYAWCQTFGHGDQHTGHKVTSVCRARAVRRLKI